MTTRPAWAVIGAGFGDEGKGHMVDYLAANLPDPIVVRSNGGAQAGHRVVVGEDSHVFSHWGSGALSGAPTFLSRHFIVNPRLFFLERRFRTGLYVDPRALVTTPYDVILNHHIETRLQHGSCGAGIWETAARSAHGFGTLAIRIGDDEDSIREKCRLIREEYAEPRLVQATGMGQSVIFEAVMRSEEVLETFMEEFFEFQKTVEMIGPEFLEDFNGVIFEGAQGLLLDQDHEFSPHVTGSNTGLTNISDICNEAGITDLKVAYVLRTYLTRHGAGPFPSECGLNALYNSVAPDPNNPENPWQGRMRYGLLDPPLLRAAIEEDRKEVYGSLRASAGLAITHLDEYRDSRVEALGLPIWFESHGPDRADVYAKVELT